MRASLPVEPAVYVPVSPHEAPAAADCVMLCDYELEAVFLVHVEGLTTEEAARRMGLSKATFWRVLEQARYKIAGALARRRPIRVARCGRAGGEKLNNQ
jgi:predicted DNA-binding protein (UPF0251 family)